VQEYVLALDHYLKQWLLGVSPKEEKAKPDTKEVAVGEKEHPPPSVLQVLKAMVATGDVSSMMKSRYGIYLLIALFIAVVVNIKIFLQLINLETALSSQKSHYF
jgi:hypothetical protein